MLEDERGKLRDALDTIEYDGITGPIKFTPGDHDMLKTVLIPQVKEGEERLLRRVTY
jgi:ABC-type branched-subunit amino acid transport system substrate-binding protein